MQAKFAELLPIHADLGKHGFTLRMGQTLEIAAYRALIAPPHLNTYGCFTDLDQRDDSTLYTKEEPPSLLSGRASAGKLDFLVGTQGGLHAGIELKNVREWLYPKWTEVKDLLRKCTSLEVLPVLVARRVPYVTFRLLNACGVIIHQTYNQLFPAADATLADKARHKDLLGYHDIRLRNEPDARMVKFFSENLPILIPRTWPTFDRFRDLLAAFANDDLSYSEFAARVRRREAGTNEDNDWPDEGENEGYE